jgi:hypothetical protein
MNARFWSTALAGCACVALATAAMAAPPQNATKSKEHPARHHVAAKTAAKSSAKKELVTFEIRGADTAKDARMLSDALNAQHVKTTVLTSQGKPYRMTAAIEPTTDLGACGAAVMKANTPEKAKDPPSLDLVVFGKFDQASAKKATDALAKIKGIDARKSSVNESKGELNVRIDGGSKVTANQIQRALQDAGVWTQFSQNHTTKTG